MSNQIKKFSSIFAGPNYEDQNKEIYILVCIDRFSKYPTAKIVKNPNAPNVESFLLKYFRLHRIPRQIRLDQPRYLIGNTVKTLCENNSIEILAARKKGSEQLDLSRD